jgi:hypothetical protein
MGSEISMHLTKAGSLLLPNTSLLTALGINISPKRFFKI